MPAVHPAARATTAAAVGSAATSPAPPPGPSPTGVWAIVAGGGTIGHLTPGLATAEALVARGCARTSLRFVGSRHGVEATRLPASGFPLTLLAGRGIRRSLSWSNVAAGAGLGLALVQSFRLLRREQPAVVLATGGYASAPCAVAAVLRGVPVVVAEQNAVLGAANRLALRLGARAVALSFADTPLPARRRRRPRLVRRRSGRAGQDAAPDVAVTGNPVRADMLAIRRAQDGETARRRLGVPAERALVVIYGGSLGARRLNVAAADARSRWRARADLAVRHVIGDRDWARATEPADDRLDGSLVYQAVRYEDDLPSCLAAADLVVSRAGASTVAELTCVGVPSVLVPLPGAPGDHQTANARYLVEAGAAVAVADAELDGATLVAVVDELLADRPRRARMEAAARALGRPGAAEAVADLVVAHARRPLPVAAAAGRGADGRADRPAARTDERRPERRPEESAP